MSGAKNMLRPLVLSFWTPPVIRPQSILIGKMIPEWVRQGVEPIIVTYDVCGQWDAGVPIYTIPLFKAEGGRNPLIRNFLEWRYYRRIYRVIKNVVKRHRPDLIFSFANPQASNILGAMVRRKLGIPFVSHFSDPWVDSPYHRIGSWFGRKKALWIESYIVTHSDAVVFTNEPAKRLVMRKYGHAYGKRAFVVPHCYDMNDYPEIAKASNKFIVSYIGAFYKERNPEVLFGAVRKMLESDAALKDRLVVKLIGAASDYTDYTIKEVETMAERYGLASVVELVPMVAYRESLAEMKRSDCLIVIDANFRVSPFFPSKVVDYAASGTPIVGITPAGSPTDEFLSGLGYRSFNYTETDGLAGYLCDLTQGNVRPVLNADYIQEFSVQSTTARLIGIFQSILKR